MPDKLTSFPATITNDQIEAEIADKAEKEGDEWLLRVQRRKPSGELEHLCTLGGGRAEHVTHADEWLPAFAGGGEYRLTAFHHTSPNRSFSGTKIVNYAGTPKIPAFALLTQPDWKGPTKILTRFDQKPEEIPSMPADGGLAASRTTAMFREGPPSAGSSPERQADYMIDRERRLMERDRQLDVKEMQARHDLEIKRLEARFGEANRPPDVSNMMKDVTTLLLTMQERSDARLERLVATLGTPKESPVLEKLLDKALSGADVAQKSAVVVQEMTVASLRNSMQMMQTFNEMIRRESEPQEEGIGGIVREIARGLADASASRKEEADAKAEAVRRARARAQLKAPAPTQPPLAKALGNGQKVAMPAAASTVATPAQSAAFAGVPEEPDEEMTALETIDDMIRSYEAPAEVIDYLIENLEDPEIQADFRKHNAKLLEWFAARHGQWAVSQGEKASEYVKQLKTIAEEKFRALSAEADGV